MSFPPAEKRYLKTDTGWVRGIGQFCLLLALIATIIPHGSPYAISTLTVAFVFSILAIIGTAVQPRNRTTRLANDALVFGAIVALYGLFQALSFPGNPFAHPIWNKANSLLGNSVQAISVDPSSTLAALPTLLLPVVAFYATVQFFDDDRAALRLIKALALIGGAFAIYGIVQLLFFPTGLAVAAIEAGHLTGFFVNRNTSGTFLGIASFAGLGWVMTSLSWYDRYRRARPNVPKINKLDASLASLCTAVCIIGLFLSLSRGALIAWIASSAMIVLLIASYFNGSERVFQKAERRWTRPFLFVLVSLTFVLIVVEFFGSRTIARIAVQGTDFARLCIYSATFQGIWDNLPFGTGLGTFATAFQQYRPAECADIEKLFIRAHNTFLEALFCLGLVSVPLIGYVYVRLYSVLSHGYFIRRRLRHFAVLGVAGVLLVSVHSLTDFSLQVPGFSVFFACYLGAITTICLPRR